MKIDEANCQISLLVGKYQRSTDLEVLVKFLLDVELEAAQFENVGIVFIGGSRYVKESAELDGLGQFLDLALGRTTFLALCFVDLALVGHAFFERLDPFL